MMPAINAQWRRKVGGLEWNPECRGSRYPIPRGSVMETRKRRRSVLQLESLEDRLALSASSGGMVAGSPGLEVGHARGAGEVQALRVNRAGQAAQARRMRVDRAAAALEGSIASLNRTLDQAEHNPEDPAARKGVSRGIAAVTRSTNQLARALRPHATPAEQVSLSPLLEQLDRVEQRAQQLLTRLV